MDRTGERWDPIQAVSIGFTRTILNLASVDMIHPLGDADWEPGLKQTLQGCALSVWPGRVTHMPIRSTNCATTKRPTPFSDRKPLSPATDRWSIWRLCTAVKLTEKGSRSHRRGGLTKGPSCFTTKRPARSGIRKKTDCWGSRVCSSKISCPDEVFEITLATRWSMGHSLHPLDEISLNTHAV